LNASELSEGERMSELKTEQNAAKKLAFYFYRNGYVCCVDLEKRDTLGARTYKKGDEIRLVATSDAELLTMQELLLSAGFSLGNPFKKAQQYCQPIYGRNEVARFLSLIGETK
jgi:hypothetical protein